ncbi:MAG: DinB family protein, partial [Gaiellaceae bacterium]
LTPLADQARGGDLPERVRGLRRKVALERGLVVPTVRMRDNVSLPADTYAMRVNGVEVAPLVEIELNRRFPGRADRRAEEPGGLRVAWEVLERTWTGTLERVATMPASAVDVSVAGEWSLAQTLRHLVYATDMWLGRAILRIEQPFHPVGLAYTGAEGEVEVEGSDGSIFTTGTPLYRDVLVARAGRVAMVREFLAAVTAAALAETRTNPHDPDCSESTLSCLHTILQEEWEHHRYAVRDLDEIEATLDAAPAATSAAQE